MVDMVLFTESTVTYLQCVYKCSKRLTWPWIESVAHFISPTEMGGSPFILVAHMTVYVCVCAESNVF
jgi:hypothetical protein